MSLSLLVMTSSNGTQKFQILISPSQRELQILIPMQSNTEKILLGLSHLTLDPIV